MKKYLFLLLFLYLSSGGQAQQIGGGAIIINPTPFIYENTTPIYVTRTGAYIDMETQHTRMKMKVFQNFANSNVIDYDSIFVDGNLVHYARDEAAPFFVSSVFIGANHGEVAVRITATAHGKTNVDIGSEWIDGVGVKWYIIRIDNINEITFLSEYVGDETAWSFQTTMTGNLSHSQNATNTSTITIASNVTLQLYPAVQNHQREMYVDGVLTLADGDYIANDSIMLFESYSITNPVSIVNTAITNVGSASPCNLCGNSMIDIIIKRTFFKNGSCVIRSNFTVNIPLDFGYFGVIQSQPMDLTVWNTAKAYLPLSEIVGGTDYNNLIDFTNPLPTLNFTAPALIRCVRILYDNITPKVGFAHGYHFDQPIIVNRAANVQNSWGINTSGKSYPRILEGQGVTIPATSTYNTTAYRHYFPIKGSASAKTSYQVGDNFYTYIDFHEAGDYDLKNIHGFVNMEILSIDSNITFTKSNGKINFVKTGTGLGSVLIRSF